jgi:hypothetical protein
MIREDVTARFDGRRGRVAGCSVLVLGMALACGGNEVTSEGRDDGRHDHDDDDDED